MESEFNLSDKLVRTVDCSMIPEQFMIPETEVREFIKRLKDLFTSPYENCLIPSPLHQITAHDEMCSLDGCSCAKLIKTEINRLAGEKLI